MAKQQSLAAKEGALGSMDIKLPDVFQAPMEKIQPRFIAPYITFAHPKRADEWNKLQAKFKQIDEGELFLVTVDSLYKLDPAKLSWLCHKQYWGKVVGDTLAAASWTEKPKPWKEYVEAVVFVYLPDRILPANVQFRSTKCPAAKSLSDTLELAGKPEWADEGGAHKETLALSQPWMRFYGEVSLLPPRVSKESGRPYRATTVRTSPTTVADWRLIQAFVQDPAAQKQLQDAADRFKSRIDDVKSKIAA